MKQFNVHYRGIHSFAKRMVLMLTVFAILLSSFSVTAFASYDSGSSYYGSYTATATLTREVDITRITFRCTRDASSLTVSGRATEYANVGGGSFSISIGGTGTKKIEKNYYPTSGYSFSDAYTDSLATYFSSIHLSA